MSTYSSLKWHDGYLRLLDQRLLPHQQRYLDLKSVNEVASAIREMVVRGAPAIGVAAAYGMVLAVPKNRTNSLQEAQTTLQNSSQVLVASRPTAVNLSWAVQRMLKAAFEPGLRTVANLRDRLLQEANEIAEEDVRTNRLIAQNAFPLVPDPANFIHHCNTGGLATVDYGTALGIIRFAHEQGKQVYVYVDETRPRLQGAQLTAWELNQLGIPHSVIVDGASGFLMQTRTIDLVTVGCDRVAINGDFANKIGTYNLAIVAKVHGIPFYVAAPTSTIDPNTKTGMDIPIEERDAIEIRQIGAETILPQQSAVYNPAFDITPASYITAYITEAGIAYPPYEKTLPILLYRAKKNH